MALDPSQFQTNDPLVDYTIRIMNQREDFIADKIFVPQRIPKKLFKKYQYDVSNKRERPVKTSSKAVAETVDWGLFTTSSTAELRKLRAEIDPADERDFDAPVADLHTDAALTLQEQLWIGREKEAITLLSATNFASGLTSTAAAPWATTGNPMVDSATARVAVRTACGVEPTSLAMSWTAYQKMIQGTVFADRVKYSGAMGSPLVTMEAVKGLMGVKNLYIAGGISTTAVEGAAAQTLADQWGNFALFFVEGVPGRRGMCFGNNFLVDDLYSREYQDDSRGSREPISFLEMGWWYSLEKGAVDTAGSNKFIAGYRIDTIY